jgi:hypothetical protein
MLQKKSRLRTIRISARLHSLRQNSVHRAFLEGHAFRLAVNSFIYSCHPEATLVAEGSAFLAFSAASSVVPYEVENTSGLRDCVATTT